jgi:hypothetical protein
MEKLKPESNSSPIKISKNNKNYQKMTKKMNMDQFQSLLSNPSGSLSLQMVVSP